MVVRATWVSGQGWKLAVSASVLCVALHLCVIELLGERSLPWTYLFGALSFAPLLVMTYRRSRTASQGFRQRWVIWEWALAGSMMEFLVIPMAQALHFSQAWSVLPTFFQAIGFSLTLVVLSTPAHAGSSRLVRAIDVCLAAAVCGLFWIAILGVPSICNTAPWLHCLTLFRAVLFTAAVLAMRASTNREEHRLMRWIAIFEGLDLATAFVLNQVMGGWLGQLGATRLDWLMIVPGLGLAVWMRWGGTVTYTGRGRSRYVARSGLPLFLSLILLAFGIYMLPLHSMVGMAGIALALGGYALRSMETHSRSMEVEENLRSSVSHLRGLADEDALTQTGNRRMFDQALEQAWSRVDEDTPLALLVVDLDRFKQINDTLGHGAGDACLRAVAGVLRRMVRDEEDTVCRLGGDEFVLLLPGAEPGKAVEIARRVCAGVRALSGVELRGLRLTVSVGVASSVECGGFRAAELLAAADRNLYLAKQGGRDQVGVTLEEMAA